MSVKSLLDSRVSPAWKRSETDALKSSQFQKKYINADRGGDGAVKRLPCTWLGRNKFRPKYAKSFNGPAVFSRGTGEERLHRPSLFHGIYDAATLTVRAWPLFLAENTRVVVVVVTNANAGQRSLNGSP